MRILTGGEQPATSGVEIEVSRVEFRDIPNPEEWDLSGMWLSGKWFSSRRLCEINFTDAVIKHTSIGGRHSCTSSEHGITAEQLYSTKSYKEGNLSGVYLVIKAGEGDPPLDLSNQILTDATIRHPCPQKVILDNAVISGMKLGRSGSRLSREAPTLEQVKSTWNFKYGRMDSVALPDEVRQTLEETGQATKE